MNAMSNNLHATNWVTRKAAGLTAVVRREEVGGDAEWLLRKKIWIDDRRYFVMAVDPVGSIWPGKGEEEIALAVRALL